MIETLFTLAAIFVAYIAYGTIHEQKTHLSPIEDLTPTPVIVTPMVAEPIKSIPPVIKTLVPEKKPATSEKKPPIKSTIAPNIAKSSIRNPKTGEIASVAGNYRFMKRWIKEALVAEGLLSKIYKNNELDAETESLIKAALTQLETMAQYHL